MADQAVLKYLSIDTTFDPCYLSLDSTFKPKNPPQNDCLRKLYIDCSFIRPFLMDLPNRHFKNGCSWPQKTFPTKFPTKKT